MMSSRAIAEAASLEHTRRCTGHPQTCACNPACFCHWTGYPCAEGSELFEAHPDAIARARRPSDPRPPTHICDAPCPLTSAKETRILAAQAGPVRAMLDALRGTLCPTCYQKLPPVPLLTLTGVAVCDQSCAEAWK
jgi:hypothetical protein